MLSISFSNRDIFSDLIKRLKEPLTSEQERDIADAIQDNFEEVWSSKGASIGSPWGNNVDLVETGALKQEMTSGRGIKINPQSIAITSSRPYASFVNKRYRFMALSSKALRQLAQIYTRKSIIQR